MPLVADRLTSKPLGVPAGCGMGLSSKGQRHGPASVERRTKCMHDLPWALQRTMCGI